jgi:hypothetical protein
LIRFSSFLSLLFIFSSVVAQPEHQSSVGSSYALGFDDLVFTVLKTDRDEMLGELALIEVNGVCQHRPKLMVRNQDGQKLVEPVRFAIQAKWLKTLPVMDNAQQEKKDVKSNCDTPFQGEQNTALSEIVIEGLYTGSPSSIYKAVFKDRIQ